MGKQYRATDYAYGIAPGTSPSIIGVGGGCVAGGTSITVVSGAQTRPDGTVYSAFSSNAPITVGYITSGSSQDAETITPSSIGQSLGVQNPTIINYATTFTYAHGQGSQVISGTVGLQEAINDCAANGGGNVVVDGGWAALGGTTAIISAAVNGSKVFINDNRGPFEQVWTWNGTAFIATPLAAIAQNGQSFVPFHNSELIVISTSGSTSDSVGNLLPANSLILLVTGYVQTTIGTSTTWELGDPTTAARFSTTSSAVTAGSIIPTTSIPPVQIGTGVANATTGIWQLAAAKVRITTSGTSSAGKVRVDVYGFTCTLPTS